MLLFKTPIGSRLYGLNHKDSDHDSLEVYANRIPSPLKDIRQTIVGKDDVVRMNLSTFMMYADRSSHQILEAMYSPYAEVDLIRDLRLNYHVNTGSFVSLYKRTVRSFNIQDNRKSKLHACRMHFNFLEGLNKGYFSPVLRDHERDWLLSSEIDDFDNLVLPYWEEHATLLPRP